MTLNLSNYTWFCRSAIQAAIIKADGSLFERVFKELYEVDRDFLFRIYPIIAAKGCWPVCPEVFQQVTAAQKLFDRGTGPTDWNKGREALLAIGRKLVMLHKNRDVYAVQRIVTSNKDGLFPSYSSMFESLRQIYAIPKTLGSVKWYERDEKLCEAVRDQEIYSPITQMVQKLDRPMDVRFLLLFITAFALIRWGVGDSHRSAYNSKISFEESNKKLPSYSADLHTRPCLFALHKTARRLKLSFHVVSHVWYWNTIVTSVNDDKKMVFWPKLLAEEQSKYRDKTGEIIKTTSNYLKKELSSDDYKR